MRACKCGGVIRQHQLTRNREAWTCNACGRYEAIQRESLPEDEHARLDDESPEEVDADDRA